MKKYRKEVEINTTAYKTIGVVEFDTVDEYDKKANELWKSQDYDTPSVYACNDFEHDDNWSVSHIREEDLTYYENE